MKVIVWGTGKTAEEFIRLNKDYLLQNEVEILFFCDNDISRQGKIFGTKKCLNPNAIIDCQYDYIVIASIYYEEIISQITKLGHYRPDTIHTWRSFIYFLNCRNKYFKRYGKYIKKDRYEDKEKHITVYTAITGNYDNLNEPLTKDENTDYICFTNSKNITSKTWEIIYINDDSLSDVKLSKRIKILPHEYFKCDGVCIWVDARIKIVGSVREYVNIYFNGKLLCFPHRERSCIADETAALIERFPEFKADFIKQAAFYFNDGYPINNGLFENGCLVRNMNDVQTKEIMYHWWSELERFTFRDQLSLPYICWKYQYSPDICDQFVLRNRWFQGMNHKQR
ncbi:glycosyltransferase domain-containing protein [Butyrivibrio sp. MC2013]|uniref:glycosyltransferase domain-containing protein n=1 Tax=Butyrivibrio sp. MC2013 TaxID=1280686 RepID=UPI0003F67211|nr:glycosyltransferase domain-containing protein [Butyrivibrio sp. MC2013]